MYQLAIKAVSYLPIHCTRGNCILQDALQIRHRISHAALERSVSIELILRIAIVTSQLAVLLNAGETMIKHMERIQIQCMQKYMRTGETTLANDDLSSLMNTAITTYSINNKILLVSGNETCEILRSLQKQIKVIILILTNYQPLQLFRALMSRTSTGSMP